MSPFATVRRESKVSVVVPIPTLPSTVKLALLPVTSPPFVLNLKKVSQTTPDGGCDLGVNISPELPKTFLLDSYSTLTESNVELSPAAKGKDYDHKDKRWETPNANRGNDGEGTKKESGNNYNI